MRVVAGGAALVVAAGVLGACSSPGVAPVGVEVASGWRLEVVRTDLDRPTQVTVAPDGRVVVAQLSGEEGAGTGTVVDLGVDAEAEAATVLVADLDVPTGVAVVGDDLFVQQPTSLLRLDGAAAGADAAAGAAGGGDAAGAVATDLVADLPNNGRSQGTITPLPDGRLAFAASGTGSGPSPDPRSGTLYAIAPDAAPGTVPDVVATGLKNAYGHAPLRADEAAADGVSPLAVTEIGDGRYDGGPPPDELVLVPTTGPDVPTDAGWPRCLGDRDPVVDNGGTPEVCAATRPALVTFAPGATPTSVADGGADTLLVALWVEGRVVEVSLFDGSVADVLTGVDGPQHLVADGAGGWWLTVHGTGELWRLRAEETRDTEG